MIAQRSWADKAFVILIALLATDVAAGQPPKDAPLGRAGPATLDAAEFDVAISEARILERWRVGREPPIAALRSSDLRRRVVIKALETRVVRGEATRRGLLPSPDALQRALVNALEGRPYDAPAGPAPADLEAQLAARYAAPVAHIRQVATDLIQAKAFAESLVDAVPEAEHRARWMTEETRVTLDLLRVPRVPAGYEIEAAVALEADDIDIWYDIHRERYDRPEKARIRRVLARPADASPAANDAARARAVAWVKRLAAGEVDAVMGEGDGTEAKRGGRFGRVTRAQLPQAFDAGAGGHTAPIREADGWAVYHVESVVPALHRPRHDRALRREIAATLLRDGDVLPHARQVAERARYLLRTRPAGDGLTRLLKAERIRRSETPPFAQSERTLVPGIGLAPELVEAVFALKTTGAVTPIVRVRQDYVIARLVARTTPDAARWPVVKAGYISKWKASARRTAVQDWLSETLRGQPLWLDTPRIANIDVPGVGTAVDKLGRPITSP